MEHKRRAMAPAKGGDILAKDGAGYLSPLSGGVS